MAKCTYHLERAIAIQCKQPDHRRWPELIAELPEAAQEAVRLFLEAERVRCSEAWRSAVSAANCARKTTRRR